MAMFAYNQSLTSIKPRNTPKFPFSYSWSPVRNPDRQVVPSRCSLFPGGSISNPCMVASCPSTLPFLLSHPTGKAQGLVSVAH